MCNVKQANWLNILTRYLAHAPVVLAAVAGLLTVGVTVAHGFPPARLITVVVSAAAAIWAHPLPAARLRHWEKLSAEKRQISTHHETKVHRAPSTRFHVEVSLEPLAARAVRFSSTKTKKTYVKVSVTLSF